MKIVVIGGTGLIGAKLAAQLQEAGHQVVAAARSTGVDTVTGEGVETVLTGADVVIDVSNPGYTSPEEMQRFFQASAANLLAAERKAGVGHHITLSAVGVDRIDGGYFLAKRAQEDPVIASDIPFTIVRSTPFFEYIYNIVDAGSDGDVIRLPPILVQPIAADDVAKALLRVALTPANDAIIELAGPDTYTLPQLAEEMLTATEDTRQVIVDPDALYFGARVGDEPLTGGRHPRFASTSFEDWHRKSMIPA